MSRYLARLAVKMYFSVSLPVLTNVGVIRKKKVALRLEINRRSSHSAYLSPEHFLRILSDKYVIRISTHI